MAYATTTQLARKLGITEATHLEDLTRVLDAATAEIDHEIGGGLDASNTEEEFALAETVCLARAQDLWTIETLPVGVIGLGGESPMLVPRNSWERHANALAPLKHSWGIA